MKNKVVLFVIVIPFFAFLLIILEGCRRPFGLTINNNKEMAKLIPTVREDAPLVIEKLETLRFEAMAGEKRYAIYKWLDRIQLSDGYEYYNFMESLDQFSQEEIDAIEYLLLSEELQLNATSISFLWDTEISPRVTLAQDRRYLIQICYFETDEEPNNYQRWGDYVEELGGNYWIIFLFMEFGRN